MGFYNLSKDERLELTRAMGQQLLDDIQKGSNNSFLTYFSDEDTYIRKAAYLATGKIYTTQPQLQPAVLSTLDVLFKIPDEKVRQTAINAAGEIGMKVFEPVAHFFDEGLFDPHHSVRNAVIGSVKKMGEKNPVPTLQWAKKYLRHPDKEVRREICHGIELRGRTHPGDILPLLQELESDSTARVRNTLIHVIGQIAYKKNCLGTVIGHLKQWSNKDLVLKALDEIISIHDRYKDFAALTQEQAIAYIDQHYNRQR